MCCHTTAQIPKSETPQTSCRQSALFPWRRLNDPRKSHCWLFNDVQLVEIRNVFVTGAQELFIMRFNNKFGCWSGVQLFGRGSRGRNFWTVYCLFTEKREVCVEKMCVCRKNRERFSFLICTLFGAFFLMVGSFATRE